MKLIKLKNNIQKYLLIFCFFLHPASYFAQDQNISNNNHLKEKNSSLKIQSTESSSNNQNTQKISTIKIKEIFDSNAYEILPNTGFALLYFYSKEDDLSLKMKKNIINLQLKEKMPFYSIDVNTNTTLSHTYKITSPPAIVIIQNKRIIYSTEGFTSNMENLSSTLNDGITKNNSITQ